MSSWNRANQGCDERLKWHTLAGFVRWASEQVEIYAETFRRQVYGADQDGKVIQESLEVTTSHGAMVSGCSGPEFSASLLTALVGCQLRDVGLDFTFLLDGLLRPDVQAASQQSAEKPPVAAAALRPVPASQGSAVAMARQSIFLMQGAAQQNGSS